MQRLSTHLAAAGLALCLCAGAAAEDGAGAAEWVCRVLRLLCSNRSVTSVDMWGALQGMRAQWSDRCAAQLHGVPELAELVLEKQVRIGRPLRISGLAEATSGPAFSTCAGLLRYGVEKYAGIIEDAPANENAPASRIARIGQWLKESF